MGGLVLRSMISSQNELWKKITASKKTKVLMLGVPNEGSYSLIRILLGKDAVIRKLALLDFVHSRKELLDIFKDFTGLLQLLPANQPDIYDVNVWNDLTTASNGGVVPTGRNLARSKKFYNSIKDTFFDNDIFRYVAGQAESTPSGYSFNEDKTRLGFSASAEGDGRVLWSTIPTALHHENVYYVNADHGSIPQYEKAFEGFRDLLLQGRTGIESMLKVKPVTRGSVENMQMPDSDFVTIPGATDLLRNLLGTADLVRKSAVKQMISVSVINGDLVHSSYPVVVGHFKGDGIVNAEKYLDQALGFRLSEYHFMNNYPGDIGSHLIILDEKKGQKGSMTCEGVVVGLGEFGELTEGKLLVTLTQAFLALAVRFNEMQETASDVAINAVDFGISALTVGSDFAGLRLGTSVKTIFLAVLQANEKLLTMAKRDGAKFNYKRINHIEIVEIYQHKSIQVGRAIGSLLKQDGFTNFRFAPPEIRIGSGSLSKIAEENLLENWHRLEVSVIKKEEDDCFDSDGKKKGRSGGVMPIRFTAITDKAHADETLLAANRLVVEKLVEKMSKHSGWDKAFSQTMYELLIPNSFKGFGSSLHNMVLIVDKDTARYPWELLQDPNGISDNPMVINTGIVRQLKTGDQRENVIVNVSDRALVIGNPFTDGKYPDLPAAEKEAKSVHQLLATNGLEATSSFGEEDIAIIQKLLIKSYKIIHIASHGIVGNTAAQPTGIILGKEIVFTAGDFDQIRIVPEFVFINCCSSNAYKPEVAEQMLQKYKLAASVGTQLIQMGVKAAIVTGWEIDDDAAQTFSKIFYECMFGGYSFGDAVRAARSKTFDNHPGTNTWGAYQCYGDPFYAFKSNARVKKVEHNFVSPVEVTYALDNLVNEMTSGSKRSDKEQCQQKIESIVSGLHIQWLENGAIIERIATAYKTVGLFEKAIVYYEQLFSLENANYSVRSVEQYYNTKVKFAREQLKNKNIDDKKAAGIYNDAIRGMDNLNGSTQERHNLLAGAYRRLYEATSDLGSLLKASEHYQKAYLLGKDSQGRIHSYPFFNWLHLAILLQGSEGDHDYLTIPSDREELEKKALDYARESGWSEPDFWKKAAATSAYLGKLLSATSDDTVDYKNQIVNDFTKAWKKEGSENTRLSFIEYLDFLKDLISKANPGAVQLQTDKIKWLDEIAGEIKKV